MSIYKKRSIITILFLIAYMYLFNTFVDFSRLFDYCLYDSFSNEILKRINVLLAAAIIFLAGKDSLSMEDNRRMKAVFVVISLGEICFLLKNPVLAISFFAICQFLLIARHGKGLRVKLLKASLSKKLQLIFIGFTLFSIYFLIIAALRPYLTLSMLVLAGGIYGMILSISLWTGLACSILALRPIVNSKMIAIGMLCFFCCDILVGLDGILGYSIIWMIASSLIWVFYTPAITLLALSTYRYASVR